jgi:hypothetical protein
MNSWRIESAADKFRIVPQNRRSFDSEVFSWSQLLYGRLGAVKVLVLYFPSRFDLPLDKTVQDSLRNFGKNTGSTTSVGFWDQIDPQFDNAIALFNLKHPPALVLTSGLQLADIEPLGPEKANLYNIVITDTDTLSDPNRLSAAVNAAHEILIRANPKEICAFLRMRALQSFLDMIADLGGTIRDEILKCKPKLSLPGDISIQVGG